MTDSEQTPGEGQRLLFLVSQPRAGSTMLQRMLARHPDIHTTSEPWLLVPPLTILDEEEQRATLSSEIAAIGLTNFLHTLPGGMTDYHAGMGRMYEYLYNRSSDAAGKQLFLDKTPRYAVMLEQILAVFPAARFVVLVRNPLAVLVSILTTWCGPRLYRLHRFRHDLLGAPVNMAALLGSGRGGVCRVKYEELVQDPEPVTRDLCLGLGLEPVPGLHAYPVDELPRWELGDQKSVYNYDTPQSSRRHGWREELHRPRVWRLCQDYLDCLDPQVLAVLGYERDELQEILDDARPGRVRRRFTVPLSWCLSPWLGRAGRRRQLRRLPRIPGTVARTLAGFVRRRVLYYPRVMYSLGFRGSWQVFLRKVRPGTSGQPGSTAACPDEQREPGQPGNNRSSE